MKRTAVLLALAALTLGALYAAGYLLGLRSGLAGLSERARATLTQADDRLAGQLEKFQYFPSKLFYQ